MEQVDLGKFSCDGCGKTYKWKPDFAGRKVKCKCGFVMTAPKESPAAAAADEPDLDALYSLADEGKQAARSAVAEVATIRCPSCKTALEPGSSLCAECGFNLKTGSKARPKAASAGAAGTAFMPGGGGGGAAVAAAPAGGAFAAFGAPRRGLQKDEITENNLLDYYLPIGLIVAGVALTILQAMKFDARTLDTTGALMMAGTKLIISMVLLGVACIFCIKWGEIAFGAPGPAALKMAGIALAPAAIAQIIGYLVQDHWGMVSFFLAFGMYFVLFHYLFEWDMSEKWVVTGVACVVCMLATRFLADHVLSGSLPGITVADKETEDEDRVIDYAVQLGTPKEARAWINDHNGRVIGAQMSHEDSVTLINDLYALGPKDKEIYIMVHDGPQAGEVLVKLPSDKKKRKAFFDYCAEFGKKSGQTPREDKGGDWLVFPFLPVNYPPPL